MASQLINYLILPHFPESSVRHGIFGRHGGSGSPPFDSLNISYGVGDSPETVQANRQLIKAELQFDRMLSSRQVHSDAIGTITELPGEDQELDGFDALISNVPGLGLMVQQADCQAVMLHDPVRNVVANVHSGWRGSVSNIIAKTITRMVADFNTSPSDILAVVSPSLGPCCAEFVNYRFELPEDFLSHQVRPHYFDFWAISRDQLKGAGVRPQHIHLEATCTVCNHEYFSYRRDGKTGRSASVIGLI